VKLGRPTKRRAAEEEGRKDANEGVQRLHGELSSGAADSCFAFFLVYSFLSPRPFALLPFAFHPRRRRRLLQCLCSAPSCPTLSATKDVRQGHMSPQDPRLAEYVRQMLSTCKY